MKPDVGFVRERFQSFNELIFEGELPDIEIIISKSKSFLGRLEYKRRRRLLGRVEVYDLKMRVSARVDMPLSEVEDTIIHEMIHLYILVKGLKDSSTHGEVFRRKAAEINERYGRNVSISHRFTNEQREELMVSMGAKMRIVAHVTLSDGRCGVKVIPDSSKSLSRFKRGVRLWADIQGVRYYKSNNTFFNRYPCSSAPKIQLIEESVLLEQLVGAERIG